MSGLLGEDDQPLAEFPHESHRSEVLAWAGTVVSLLEKDRDSAVKAEATSATGLKKAMEDHEKLDPGWPSWLPGGPKRKIV